MPAPKLKKLPPPNIPKDCKLKKNAGVFDDKYIQYKSEGDEKLTMEQYLQKIRPYLHDVIGNLKTSGKWKIDPSMNITVMSSKDSGEKLLMHSKSGKRQVMFGFDTEEIFVDFLNFFLHRYQEG